MENKFTARAQNALILALREAEGLGHTYIGSEHLLLGILQERDSVAYKMLSKRGISYGKIKSAIYSHTDIGEKTALTSQSITPRLKRIIDSASRLSEKNSQTLIGSEHLLYSLLGENDCLAVRTLEQNGLLVSEMQNDILSFIHTCTKPKRSLENKKASAIETYGRDLIDIARQGKIDPTLCRERETERVIQILCRRTKNNPCLIGEPGVGKTAVVEGLAMRISEGNVPPFLASKKIYALDIPSLIAGAKYRGEFEDRIKNVMAECRKDPDVILFIDEIHTIIGAGGAEGAIDAANILKPALSRGEIQIIGATTITEYRKHIERDSALERRFQPVSVAEPTAEETEKILLGLRERYEKHHALTITDEALKAAVELSQRYINDRFLPDKAIDLIDEASSRVKLENYGEAKATSGRGRKNAEKLPSVTYEDVARVVRDWTNIPVSRLVEGEEQKLLMLEKELSSRIIGQNSAIELLSQAIRRGRTGLGLADKPTGSFLFVGPTGVGKTELCLSLAEILFGSKSSLIRFDMSEYMEKHSISKLIGAPPGYVGYGEGGLLTEKVRTKPYSVVLFDEIEKAHPEVFNLLLQIFEDGTLTDAQGRRISFKNTVIIMTSNLGSAKEQTAPLGFFSNDDVSARKREREKRIRRELEQTFKPELLSRIDEIIIFNSLSRDDIEKICSLMLGALSRRLERLDIKMSFSNSVSKMLADISYDEKNGAREVRREIRRLIENEISSKLLSGEIRQGDAVRAEIMDNSICFIKEKSSR